MKSLFRTVFICGTAMLIALATAQDCYAQKKAKKEKAPKGKSKAPSEYKLAYNIPEGKSMSYYTRTNMLMTLDFSGQSVNANVTNILAATALGKGIENGNLKLEVRIDTMSQVTDTPNGAMGGIINDVTDKTFTMLLSSSGKEVDLSDARKISFKTENMESDISQSFIDYFPDVPAKAIKPGDTWPTDDTVKSVSVTATVNQITHAENTFAGIEIFDGIECAKITSKVSGTREVSARTMGMDMAQTMKFDGTGELYFAVKEGYPVKQQVNSKVTGTVEFSGAQTMSMPMTGDMVIVSRLKK